jgi:tetratricopeptide (TPR) repeat protein
MIITHQGSVITRNTEDVSGAGYCISPGNPVPSTDPINIISDNEEMRILLVGESGMRQVGAETEVDVGFPVGMVVTDRRILFVPAEDPEGKNAGELSYGELAGIDVTDSSIELTTTDGVVWEFPVGRSAQDDVNAARRHLQWLGQVRNRVVSYGNDVQLAAGIIRSQADELEWEGAEETYQKARGKLDDLICDVQCTEPIPDEVLAPELADIDRSLEKAHIRLSIERSKSQLELGRHLVENEDYEQARKVLEAAQNYFEQARDWREEIERGDSFQFGRQREIRKELEDLGWEIETVAAEPIRQAHEAKVRAENTDDPVEAVDNWETAFRRYGNVLTLEWGDEGQNFAGDPAEVREEMRAAATRLIDLHEAVGAQRWNDGSKLESQGDLEAAEQRCKSATEHLERAHELAEEFDPPRAAEFETRLEEMFRTLLEIRNEIPSDRPADPPADRPDGGSGPSGEQDGSVPPTEGPEKDPWPPSLDDLSDMDTHHELTMVLDEPKPARSVEEPTGGTGRESETGKTLEPGEKEGIPAGEERPPNEENGGRDESRPDEGYQVPDVGE